MSLGPGAPSAFFTAICADFDVDPFPEMFFFPQDTYKLSVHTVEGKTLWTRDLGRGVVPGMWFCPFLPVDLDGDGRDEIYFVGNDDPQHPLTHHHRVLERLDAQTGETTGQWPWPAHLAGENPSYAYRNFLVAGNVGTEKVLVTAQGTYGAMFLQGWNADLSPRWQTAIPADSPGARGSHMCPVVDWFGDGADCLFWGERLLRMDDGTEVFCADRDAYDGHSDIVQPFRRQDGSWAVFTCRETEHTNHNFPERGRVAMGPRVVVYDSAGERLWGAVESGHMDMGWVARVGPSREALGQAIRIGKKTCGPTGRFHTQMDEFYFDAETGEPRSVGWSGYRALPVDLDGDGAHEFVRGAPGGDGALWRISGEPLGSVGGPVAFAGKLTEGAGEQLLTYHPTGQIRLWEQDGGEDSEAARARFSDSFYRANQRLSASGSNLANVAGI